ncbi:MAG: hypothetical protein JNL39_03800 [Opitutaceae bacterium]|nr:hypothetical protein [Opitutaceae bacterium]
MTLPAASFTRRDLLKAGVATALGATIAAPARAASAANAIVAENAKPGTTDWQLTFVRSASLRSPSIEGYCSHTSVRAGGEIDVFVSTDQPTQVHIDFYRMGYYGGKGGRHLARLGPFAAKPQPLPPVGARRLRECKWERTARVAIPRDWVSGVYLGKLSCAAHRHQSYVIFVVRDDRKADLLFQTSDTTWQAYNKWPDSFSLYDSDPPPKPWGPDTMVSYDRPYGKYPQVVDNILSQGSGSFLLWEFPLCFWLEQHGYDVTYWASLDTHADAAGLARAKCFLSIGHDEYWSVEMYENVKRAIAGGMSVAFLCGNSVHGVVPLHKTNGAGRAGRLLYRQGLFGGPVLGGPNGVAGARHSEWERHGPPEELLVGAQTMNPANGSANWTATNTRHWLFDGTGMKDGDAIPGLVGWEFHGAPGAIPGLEVVAAGEAIKGSGEKTTYAATIYPGPKGNWVFNAATIYWSIGLATPPGFVLPWSHWARPHGADGRVQRITANFLARCGARPARG